MDTFVLPEDGPIDHLPSMLEKNMDVGTRMAENVIIKTFLK